MEAFWKFILPEVLQGNVWIHVFSQLTIMGAIVLSITLLFFKFELVVFGLFALIDFIWGLLRMFWQNTLNALGAIFKVDLQFDKELKELDILASKLNLEFIGDLNRPINNRDELLKKIKYLNSELK